MPRVDAVATGYRKKLYWMSMDDIRAEGYMVLVKLAPKWEPSRGAQFWTFAEHRVRGRFLDLAKFRRRHEVKLQSLPDEHCVAILGGRVW